MSQFSRHRAILVRLGRPPISAGYRYGIADGYRPCWGNDVTAPPEVHALTVASTASTRDPNGPRSFAWMRCRASVDGQRAPGNGATPCGALAWLGYIDVAAASVSDSYGDAHRKDCSTSLSTGPGWHDRCIT